MNRNVFEVLVGFKRWKDKTKKEIDLILVKLQALMVR